MIFVDTSAWFEFLTDTRSEVCNTVDDLLGDDLAICEAISMEVLVGARSEQHLAQLRGLLARAKLIPIIAQDYDQAAALYRTCQRNGDAVRKLIDYLIASFAIRLDAPVLHADADFAALARHRQLALHANSAK